MGADISQFSPAFQQAVNGLTAACPGSTISSGFRSRAQQEYLYGEYKAGRGNLAAAPGSSNHENPETGAVDVDAGEGGYECLHSKMAEFGLHAPVGGEPWHFELINADAEAGEVAPTEAQAEPEDPLDAAERFMFGGDPDPEVEAQRIEKAANPDAAEADVAAVAQAGTEEPSQNLPEIAEALYRAGFRGEDLVTMLAISIGESGANPAAEGDQHLETGKWGPSVGAFQVRTLNAEDGSGGWRDKSALLNSLDHQAKAAYSISNGGSKFTDWTVYNHDLYQQHLDAARDAAAGIDETGQAQAPPLDAPVLPVNEDELLLDPFADPLEGGLIDPAVVAVTGAPEPEDLLETGAV